MTSPAHTLRRRKACHPNKLLLDTFGLWRIYEVDGQRVRDTSLAGQEFGESASHFTLPLVVPAGEIWIEDDVTAEERPFVISGALRIAQLRDYEAGKRYEKHLREKAALAGTEWKGEWLSADCYVRDLGVLPNGVKVSLVNGEKVRDETKTDFMEGGHDLVYPWLPPKTIILEAGLHPDELPIILDHEAPERRKMANGMKYPRAHLYAAKEEWTARQHGAPDWAVQLVTLGHCLEHEGASGGGGVGAIVCATCKMPIAS